MIRKIFTKGNIVAASVTIANEDIACGFDGDYDEIVFVPEEKVKDNTLGQGAIFSVDSNGIYTFSKADPEPILYMELAEFIATLPQHAKTNVTNMYRAYRDHLLYAADWNMLNVELTETQTNNLIEYKVDLRNVPQQDTWPDRIVCPNWPL